MKKNFLKLSIYGVCAMFIATSCLETEELDSVKKMREAKADKLQAEADAAVLKNAYDSAVYKLNLTVSAASSQYSVADYGFKQQMLKLSYSKDSLDKALSMLLAKSTSAANIAYQEYLVAQYQRDEQSAVNQMNQMIEDAKVQLIQAQINFVNNQSNLFKAKQNYKSDSINAVAKNQTLTNLYNDYFGYFNGGITLSTGVYISKGIFTLRGDILTEKGNLLTATNNKNNDIETKANQILSHRDNIRTDSLGIVAKQKTITVYQNAKTSADYTDAINDITSLVNSAEIDFVAKQNARALLEEPKAKAYDADTTATNTYNRNMTRKAKAKVDMNNLLTLVGVTTFNDLVHKQGTVATSLTDATADQTDKTTVYNTWLAKLNTAISSLNAAKNTKNQAQTRLDAADAVVNSVLAAGGTPTTAQTNEQTAANTALTAAITDQTDKQNIYDAVKAGYDPAQAAYEGAKTTYNNARDANDSIIVRRARYDGFGVIYDECEGKVATLLATKDTKNAEYKAALAQFNTALTAENIAKNTFVSYKACKTTLEGIALISDAAVKMSQLDDKIAAAQKDIATLNNDIADYKLQISRINKSDYTYDDAIATSNAKIAMLTSLLTEYEANATAIKAKIDAY